MQFWTSYCIFCIILFALMSVGLGLDDGLPLGIATSVFLLAVVVRMPFLKEKIPQRLLRFAGWMVLASPFIYAFIAAGWTTSYLPEEDGVLMRAAMTLFFLLAFILSVMYILPPRLFHLLKGLITEPPRSLKEWCRRFSGWVLLLVVGVGGSLSFMPWAERHRVWVAPSLCVMDFFGRGVFGTSGPGLERYLDALTNGTTTDTAWAGKRAASLARLHFLARHTQYGQCTPVDEERYMYWVQKMSAERDWPEAHYLLAFRYGYGGLVDGEMRSIGMYSSPGAGETKHIPQWVDDRFLKHAVPNDWGNGRGLDLARSFALLIKAAEGGYGDAMWFLSNAYARGGWGKDGGLVLNVDYEKSMLWLEKLAQEEDGFGYILYTLGHRYHYADKYGLQRDDAKAYEYMMKAAGSERRHTKTLDAMLELALMHKEGVGVALSAEDARVWLEKAEQELSVINEEGRKALEVLREEDNIALMQAALEQKRRKFEDVRAVIISRVN